MRMQPDAATRPQDQADFDTQIRLKRKSDLPMAARLMRRPLAGLMHSSKVNPCAR
jgi:hypothetical protein